MKKNLFLLLLLAILFLLARAFFIEPQDLNKKPTKTAQATQQIIPSELKTYTNPRFEYAIDYPKDWPVGEVATNNDGRNLYEAKDTEVLVYGSNIPSRFPEQDDLRTKQSTLVLDDGRKATVLELEADGKIKYIVFFVDEGVQYTFNVNVSKDFFDQHEAEIIKTAKSFRRS